VIARTEHNDVIWADQWEHGCHITEAGCWRQPESQTEFHVSCFARSRLVRWPGVLVPVDEKEPDTPVCVSCRGQTSQQQRTFTADDQRNVAAADRPGDLGVNRANHLYEIDRRDDAAGWVSLGTRLPQSDIAVIVNVCDALKRLEQSGGAQGCRGSGFTSRDSSRVEWDTNQANAHRFLIAWECISTCALGCGFD
jgi:hypothetical protein